MTSSEANVEFTRVWDYRISTVNPESGQVGQGGGGEILCVDALVVQPTWQLVSKIVIRR